jgi:ABC-type antimicrobial peptide transport system permease subunit
MKIQALYNVLYNVPVFTGFCLIDTGVKNLYSMYGDWRDLLLKNVGKFLCDNDDGFFYQNRKNAVNTFH